MKTNFTLYFLFLSLICNAQNSPQIPITNANWAATDALGRSIPAYEAVGVTKANKYVGMFYFCNNGYGRTIIKNKIVEVPTSKPVYDITKILAANPTNPQYGPENAPHYWGTPEADYYRTSDQWVIRRNLQMLSNAGVDFLYFDFTNGVKYIPTVTAMCELSLQMRTQGIKTPYFAFILHTSAVTTAAQIYDQFYTNAKYNDLWFRWAGKPLLLSSPDSIYRADVAAYFNMKYSWANTDQTKPNSWQWIDSYPQHWGWSNVSTDIEQLPVAKGDHAGNFMGDSYSGGAQPAVDQYGLTPYTGQGRFFNEQWSRTFSLSPTPSIVMITGWNEWTAGRFIVTAAMGVRKLLGKTVPVGGSWFNDLYNQEFNRDIEPMKNGHTDNFYYQLVSNIRKYKGMTKPDVVSAPVPVSIDGNFSEWANVTPVFTDPVGDTFHRNEYGFDSTYIYTNNTGRNDIIESRAVVENNSVDFYVKTASNLTPYTDPNWMLLFIDTDNNKSTGWEGFDILVNKSVNSPTQTTVSKWNGTDWVPIDVASYAYAGNQLELKLSRSLLGLTGSNVQFQFQWADNIQKLNDVNEFFVNGDVAPDRRFRYLYKTTSIYNGIEQVHNLSIPNYFKDIVKFDLGNTPSNVMIFNTKGSLVYSISNAVNTIEIPGSKIGGEGIYFVRINSGSAKFMVLK